jgi:heme exporter protein A
VGISDTKIKGDAALLSADRLAVSRGGRMLLSGVDLNLCAGDAVVLAGQNGVGKSSLLRVLAGLIPVFAGELTVNAELALSDENPALDVDLPLAKALHFWAAMDGSDPTARVAKALADLNISHLAEVPVRILSTGQRRRAGLARVLASGAPLWLLDEPGNGLDRDSLRALGHVIAAHREAGGAVIIATHFDLPVEDARVMLLKPAQEEAA